MSILMFVYAISIYLLKISWCSRILIICLVLYLRLIPKVLVLLIGSVFCIIIIWPKVIVKLLLLEFWLESLKTSRIIYLSSIFIIHLLLIRTVWSCLIHLFFVNLKFVLSWIIEVLLRCCWLNIFKNTSWFECIVILLILTIDNLIWIIIWLEFRICLRILVIYLNSYFKYHFLIYLNLFDLIY